MPVGCSVPVGVNGDSLDNTQDNLVTNACRLFGPCWVPVFRVRVKGLVMSPMPVGCSVPVGFPEVCPIVASIIQVTNACRLFGPCWVDAITRKEYHEK